MSPIPDGLGAIMPVAGLDPGRPGGERGASRNVQKSKPDHLEACAILSGGPEGYGDSSDDPRFMIQVDHLTKRYGPVTAIQDVSFNVEKGQIVGFLGPNGAGKSTTMKILSCFMPASGGTARIAGFDVFSQSLEVRRRIGHLPEN